MKARILIADDEVRIRIVMALLLKEDGYEVMAVENGREAVNALLAFKPDVVLLDQQMPVLNGIEALEEIKGLRAEQTVIFVTPFGSVSLAADAVNRGAYDFIEKPFDKVIFLLKVKRAVEHCRMRDEIRKLKSRQVRRVAAGKRKNANSIKEVNAQVEKELIAEALQRHKYNRTLTAESLSISRKTLFNKMKRYGIEG